jgi:hypothetical protein
MKKTHITRSIASEHFPEKLAPDLIGGDFRPSAENATTQEATDGFGTNDALMDTSVYKS